MAAPELVADVERLLEDVESLADPVARQTATGVVQALLDLYGGGLERIVDAVAGSDSAGELAQAFSEDELVSHLLLLHGLHPVPMEQRVLDALGEVRPYLESHGGNVELLGIEGSSVRLRLQGSCSGCPSSAMTLKLAIENAIQKAAPEIAEVVEVADATSIASSSGGSVDPAGAGSIASPLLQIEVAPAVADASWTTIGTVPQAEPVTRTVGGTELLFLRIAGRLYAYRTRCPACEHSLDDAAVAGTELTCGGCGNRYDALRAGRGLDLPELHLEPVPLLEGQDGLVRVALPVPV